MKPTPTQHTTQNDIPPEASTTTIEEDRIQPYVHLLYENGDPLLIDEIDAEGSQIPLYDNLSSLKKRYTEQTLIAKGGMKEIYRTLDQRTSRHVAMAKPIPTLGPDYYDAFLREAHITAKLEHPGIIKLFGMDIDEEGRPFFTMEFKTGRSLRETITAYTKGKETAHWPIAQRLQIILRICAVSYTHLTLPTTPYV